MHAAPPKMELVNTTLARSTDGFIQAKKPSVPCTGRAELFPTAGDENPRCQNYKSEARRNRTDDALRSSVHTTYGFHACRYHSNRARQCVRIRSVLACA